ncbi:MAG: Heme peroxidase [Candidatus Aminicenantes bacterium]|nr:MAG: Heme peroxidase [Candidatus Aminicenantes bacterium]
METLNLIQGSKEWHAHRDNHFNASDAPAMMGVSKYVTRDDLLRKMKSGESEEITPHLQKLFNKGHAAEASIRPHIEVIIGDDLFPVTGSIEIEGLPLSASLDGLTMSGKINFEHKLWNEKLVQQVKNEALDPHYTIQLDQQHLISECEKTIFVVSDGTPENCEYMWYEGDSYQQGKILKGWEQFEKDLAEYEYTPEPVKPVAQAIMELPALNVQITGKVETSNLTVYQESASTFIANINTDLKTDEDFSNAEAQVKYCDKAEKQLEAVKQQALAQTADIDTLFKTIDHIKGELRAKRLTLDKLVKSQKEIVKRGILEDAASALDDHIDILNKGLGGNYVQVQSNFGGAAKGKRTLVSLRDAANTELARTKIAANDLAEIVRANLKYLDNKNDHYKSLFFDLNSIVNKSPDDFENLVKSRISDFDEAEEKRLEVQREQIQQEEAAKLESKQKVEPSIQEKAPEPVKAEATPKVAEVTSSKISVEQRHKINIHKKIQIELVSEGFSESDAVKVINLIKDGEISHLQINY